MTGFQNLCSKEVAGIRQFGMIKKKTLGKGYFQIKLLEIKQTSHQKNYPYIPPPQ